MVVYLLFRNNELQQFRSTFRYLCQERSSVIQRHLDFAVGVLKSYVGLLAVHTLGTVGQLNNSAPVPIRLTSDQFRQVCLLLLLRCTL